MQRSAKRIFIPSKNTAAICIFLLSMRRLPDGKLNQCRETWNSRNLLFFEYLILQLHLKIWKQSEGFFVYKNNNLYSWTHFTPHVKYSYFIYRVISVYDNANLLTTQITLICKLENWIFSVCEWVIITNCHDHFSTLRFLSFPFIIQ